MTLLPGCAPGAPTDRRDVDDGSSDLAAGVLDGEPVIAKVARIEEERRGGRLMTWWSAHGGLPVLEADDDAILMRRAGRRVLHLLDDEAEEVLVETALALHAMPAPPASVGLVPLRTWFRDLVDRPQPDPLLDRGDRRVAPPLNPFADPQFFPDTPVGSPSARRVAPFLRIRRELRIREVTSRW